MDKISLNLNNDISYHYQTPSREHRGTCNEVFINEMVMSDSNEPSEGIII